MFTIHTPGLAGNERFEADLVRRVAGPLLDGDGRRHRRRPVERVLEIGRGADNDAGQFDMTALQPPAHERRERREQAPRARPRTPRGRASPRTGSRRSPTASTRRPGSAARSSSSYERYLDADLDDLDGTTAATRWWERIDRIPAAELWEAHLDQKRELAVFARGRLRTQFARHGEAPGTLQQLGEALDPKILTIGFARRFATYKRAGMIFTDTERLARLLADADRPVQLVFAGKAHPADRPGQAVIQEIFGRTRSPEFRGRVFILEDYDMRIGRFLVQGVDVWLNTPRRPLEASGTSGMKAGANGVVNLSVLDGWWDEGWTERQRLGDRRPRAAR